jgi:hypothetical protein
MEEDGRSCPKLLGAKFIGGGSVGMERNRVIKSLSSLFWFLELVHKTRMEVSTGCMPCFSVANDLC